MGSSLVPFFIEGNLNRQKYHDMIVEEVFPVLVQHFNEQMQDEHFERLWRAQDGAPAHRADIVQDLLQEMFPGRVITCDGDNDWPSALPGFNTMRFLSMGIHQIENFYKSTTISCFFETANCRRVQQP